MNRWLGWITGLLVLVAGGLMFLIQLGSHVASTFDRADPQMLRWFLVTTPPGSVRFATVTKDEYLRSSEINFLNDRYYTWSTYTIGKPLSVADFLTAGQNAEFTQILQAIGSKSPDNPWWYDFNANLYLAFPDDPSHHHRVYIWPKDKPVPALLDRLLNLTPGGVNRL